MDSFSYLFLLTVVVGWLSGTCGVIPQVSQEGLLRPYRSYADMTLFHYYVPNEVTRATFQFAAFMDNPNCFQRDVFIYLQHGSYPVMSPDNSTFPDQVWNERTSLFSVRLKASYKPHDASVFPVYNPLPGSWFAAAYLPNWDQQVQQQGIGHRCLYSLGSIALWSQIGSVNTIPLKSKTTLTTIQHYTYYKFYIPTGTWEFRVQVDGCRFLSSHRFPELNSSEPLSCLEHVFMRAKALPKYEAEEGQNSEGVTDAEDSVTVKIESLPYTDTYYYLLFVAQAKVSFNVTITTTECPMQILGKSFVQQFLGLNTAGNMKEQALRVNKSNTIYDDCGCVPIFRLTRIKHAQDFSDTFLLEGKEWFTTWLALTDAMPVGAYLELLPYVDIGGTLSINIHLDEILINSTSQVVHVFSCVRKGRPSKPLCCAGNLTENCCDDQGLSIHVSSEELTRVNQGLIIPFPEPDSWFISFHVICEFNGTVVPCAVEEVLISLDIRTQPCVYSRPTEPGGAVMPCGPYGYCQKVHKGQFFYTACRCLGGYRGWGCSDDREATPENLLLATTLLLTLSNIFFLPAIGLALRRRMFSHALIYTLTMVSSTMYHACDQEIYGYCLTRYSVLQFCDFFCSILAFWVTLISLARCAAKYESVLYLLGAVVIAIGTEYNRTGLMVFIIPFVMGLGLPILVWSYRSLQNRRLLFPPWSSVLLFLPGLLLGAAGLLLFAFVETQDNYRYTHSAWHVIIAISLVYLLPTRSGRKERLDAIPHSRASGVNGTLRNQNTAELAAVNGDLHTVPSASPIFFVTSDLDHLVQPQGSSS